MIDFMKVAEEYWKKEEVASAASSSANSGIAVVTPPSTESLIDAFSAAFDTPVIQSVVWPATVPANHPIRSLPVHVRLWTGPQWTKFWELSKPVLSDKQPTTTSEPIIDQEASSERLHQQFWYVVLISACDNNGNPLAPSLLPAAMVGIPFDETSQMEAACTFMKQKYSGPAGLLTMNPIYEAALGFNGLLKGPEERDAKNSDTITDSTSSGE